MSNKPIADALKIVLASSYTLYLKTHNYHWNVEGINFRALHLMFEEQYTDLAAAVDDIAERIRSLDEKAPGTFSAFSQLSVIKEGNENAVAKDMVGDLLSSHKQIVACLNDTLKVAQNAGDEVTIGLLVDRMTVHEKAAWMLKSINV